MALLADLKCTVCQAGDIPLDEVTINQKLSELPGWSVAEDGGIKKLTCVFKFKNYLSGLDFAHKVGLLAEEHGHHPAMTVEWGKVKVIWWTHKINGLHDNDFIMAAKTDLLYSA